MSASVPVTVYIVVEDPHGYEDSIHLIVAVVLSEDEAKRLVAQRPGERSYQTWAVSA